MSWNLFWLEYLVCHSSCCEWSVKILLICSMKLLDAYNTPQLRVLACADIQKESLLPMKNITNIPFNTVKNDKLFVGSNFFLLGWIPYIIGTQHSNSRNGINLWELDPNFREEVWCISALIGINPTIFCLQWKGLHNTYVLNPRSYWPID